MITSITYSLSHNSAADKVHHQWSPENNIATPESEEDPMGNLLEAGAGSSDPRCDSHSTSGPTAEKPQERMYAKRPPPSLDEILEDIAGISMEKLASANDAALAMIDHLAKIYELAEHEKISLARRKLDGNLQTWVTDCLLDTKSWAYQNNYERFKAELVEYIETNRPVVNLANLEFIKLRQTGLIEAYGKKFKELYDKVDDKLRDPQTALIIYRSGLNRRLEYDTQSIKVRTWPELQHYCEKMVRIHGPARYRRTRPQKYKNRKIPESPK